MKLCLNLARAQAKTQQVKRLQVELKVVLSLLERVNGTPEPNQDQLFACQDVDMLEQLIVELKHRLELSRDRDEVDELQDKAGQLVDKIQASQASQQALQRGRRSPQKVRSGGSCKHADRG